MNGWTGKILRVDLTRGVITKEDLNMEWARDYVGTRGLATRYLYEEMDPAVDPFSPENKLILSTGPLTGTGASTASRYAVVTKGPLTGAITGSNSGGHWGPELKFAGYDMVILEGQSPEPVYLWIYDDDVQLVSAKDLWGRTVWETEEWIRNDTGVPDCVIASIGPAGENLVRFASIMNDLHRAAGRSGVGAVMGAKKIKAVAVRGTGGVAVASPKAMMKAIWEQRGKLGPDNAGIEGMQKYGTLEIMGIINETGGLPTRNHQETQFEGEENINGEAVTNDRLLTNKACFSCTIACGRVTHLPGDAAEKFMVTTHPRNWKMAAEGPEYETAWALGAECGVGDLDALIKASWLCNDLGVDTISMGATISAAMELYEKGLISKEEAGMEINFGSGDALVALVEKTSYREGIGDELAEGSKLMGIKFGDPGVHMGSKGQEFPAYDPRTYNGMALGYATNTRGADHLRNFTPGAEVFGSPYKLDPGATEGKAELVISLQNENSIHDSTGLCMFISAGNDLEDIRKLLAAATGISYTADDMNRIGERIWNLERMFNLKAGLTKADDSLPERILKGAIPGDDNPAKGRVAKLDQMLPEYYSLRGWDVDGLPEDAKLVELGLK
ncbi:MAG: aldehyde ferredoxin oxidoreductase family protein [Chloroflexi bacterium]|nr:aldehyde ferredoxin oxidoreductase family protein [Chloroflexota bacterium]